MIFYDPGRWSISFAFRLEGSVFPRAFAWAGPCALASTLLHIHLHKRQELVGSMFPGSQAATLMTGFWAILGFLVVFRSQQAYSRWWEGCTLLQQIRGEWFNAFSNCLAFCNPDPAIKDEVDVFQHQLVRLMSLLYNCALQQVTTQEQPNFELISLDGFDINRIKYLDEVTEKVEIVLQWVQKLIVESDHADILHVSAPTMSRIHNQLGNGIVGVSNARKISEFPVPFPYTQMLTMMLIFHWMLTVFMCAVVLEHWYWATILSFIVVFSFWSINYIAVELEMPFGDDPNDLPLQGMMRDMNDSMIQLLHERSQHVPSFHYRQDLHRLCVREEAAGDSISLHLSGNGDRLSFHQIQDAVRDYQSHADVNHSPHRGSRNSNVTLGSRRTTQQARSHAVSVRTSSRTMRTSSRTTVSNASNFSILAFTGLAPAHHKRCRTTFARKDQLSNQVNKKTVRVAEVNTEHIDPEIGCSSEWPSEFDASVGEAANDPPEVTESVVELPRNVDQEKSSCLSPSSAVVAQRMAVAPSSMVDELPKVSAALPELSKLVESQVRELSHSIKTLKEFSDALPLVIDTMLSATMKPTTSWTLDKNSRGALARRSPHGSGWPCPDAFLGYSTPNEHPNSRRTPRGGVQGLTPCVEWRENHDNGGCFTPTRAAASS